MLNKKTDEIEEEKVRLEPPQVQNNIGFQPFRPLPHHFIPRQYSDVSMPNVTHLTGPLQKLEEFNTFSSDEVSSKKQRKRKRIPEERDLSPETFRKTRNKRLAKESRMRKTNYIKSLEDKISNLENKIVSLNEAIESYK